MGTCRDIDVLQPELAKRLRVAMAAFKDAGLRVGIVETDRSKEVQEAYYAQGRESLAKINALRKNCGLYLLGNAEAKRVVTNTLNSRHIGGGAVDLCPIKDNGNFYWNAPQELWERIGKIAEACGLDWCAGGYGNDWGWDNPHFELMKDWED